MSDPVNIPRVLPPLRATTVEELILQLEPMLAQMQETLFQLNGVVNLHLLRTKDTPEKVY